MEDFSRRGRTFYHCTCIWGLSLRLKSMQNIYSQCHWLVKLMWLIYSPVWQPSYLTCALMVSETDHPPCLKGGKHKDIVGEMKEKLEEESTHIDVICIDVVICAFQNDTCGIIWGRERDNKRSHLDKRIIDKERKRRKKTNVWNHLQGEMSL